MANRKFCVMGRFDRLRIDARDVCQGRRLCAEGGDEIRKLVTEPLHFNINASGVVQHPTVQRQTHRQVVDKRAKANTLYDTCYRNAVSSGIHNIYTSG